MKKLPIINQTPRQFLVECVATRLNYWVSVGQLDEGDDLKWDAMRIGFRPSRRVISRALSYVVADAKPGTNGGSMLDYAETTLDASNSAWDGFVKDVRKQTRFKAEK